MHPAEKNAADRAMSGLSDVASTAADRASDAAGRVSDKASDVYQRVRDGAADLGDKMPGSASEAVDAGRSRLQPKQRSTRAANWPAAHRGIAARGRNRLPRWLGRKPKLIRSRRRSCRLRSSTYLHDQEIA